jgi:hypothetical protein
VVFCFGLVCKYANLGHELCLFCVIFMPWDKALFLQEKKRSIFVTCFASSQLIDYLFVCLFLCSTELMVVELGVGWS